MAEQPGFLRERLGKLFSQLPYTWRGLALVWRSAPSHSAVALALLLVQGLLPVGIVYLTRAVVDSLVAVSGSGARWEVIRTPLLLALALAGLMLLGEVLQAVSRWIRTAQSELVRDHISELVQAKAVAADFAYYESPAYFDELHRVRYDVQHRPMALTENVGSLLQNTLTLVAMLAVLVRFGVWIPLALLISTLPALFVVLRSVIRQHDWRLRVTPEERRAFYFDSVLTSEIYAGEVRLFGLGQHFRALYRALRSRLRQERLALVRDEGLAGIFGATAALVITALALALMVMRAAAGAVSLGELAMFYQAFSQGQRLMRSLLESAGQVYGNSLFLSSLFKFLALQPAVVDPPAPLPAPPAMREGVVFEGVTFHYPGTDRVVLDRFNLTIPAGQVVAVVGSNGAGKTTLIKLLCRLYDPDGGRITVDGVDLRDFSLVDVRALISVLFQQPVHFHATVAENVGMGNLAAPPAPGDLDAAARAAGADTVIARLAGGWQQMLGRWFEGGVELSIGEWQRLALARAFFRRSPILLLDEPTSAMDSWAEADWMERFRELALGRTSLIITHRFTTAMRADVIHVIEAGRIVESGTHADLLGQGGRYAASWRAQMRQAGGALTG